MPFYLSMSYLSMSKSAVNFDQPKKLDPTSNLGRFRNLW